MSFDKDFALETDTSIDDIGVVLSQQQEAGALTEREAALETEIAAIQAEVSGLSKRVEGEKKRYSERAASRV